MALSYGLKTLVSTNLLPIPPPLLPTSCLFHNVSVNEYNPCFEHSCVIRSLGSAVSTPLLSFNAYSNRCPSELPTPSQGMSQLLSLLCRHFLNIIDPLVFSYDQFLSPLRDSLNFSPLKRAMLLHVYVRYPRRSPLRSLWN
jgi:hypothetical protein